jgi:hypothetical protein
VQQVSNVLPTAVASPKAITRSLSETFFLMDLDLGLYVPLTRVRNFHSLEKQLTLSRKEQDGSGSSCHARK